MPEVEDFIYRDPIGPHGNSEWSECHKNVTAFVPSVNRCQRPVGSPEHL